MRVLHLVSDLGTYGGERFVPALARAQREIGIDVAIVTIYELRDDASAGVPLHSAGRRKENGSARGGGVLFFPRLVRLLRELKPDVVHTHLAHAKLWGRLAAVAAGVPVIVHTEHGNAFDGPRYKKMLSRALHRRTAAITAFSSRQAERIASFEKLPMSRIVIVPSGIERFAHDGDRDLARAALGIGDDRRVILSVGRLNPVKGHDIAIDALTHLSARGIVNTHLYIVGEGPSRAGLVERARDRGVVGRVHLLGYREDVHSLYAGADTVVNSSRNEAMPLSLIEALCAGAPVACTPWPGAAELLSGIGSIATAFEPSALAAAIEQALEPESLERAKAYVATARERFSMRRTAERYVALYQPKK